MSDIGLSLEPRLKELILQGEKAIILEVVKQLHNYDLGRLDVSQSRLSGSQSRLEASQSMLQSSSITIKPRPSAKVKGFSLDVKKVNFTKTPE